MQSFNEHVSSPTLISLQQARRIISGIQPLGTRKVSLTRGLGRITARAVAAVSSCPSVDSSLKDGYAVVSSDLRNATPASPVALRILGTVTAGQKGARNRVAPGCAVRIMTGARIPPGADAVLASEFARQDNDQVLAVADAGPGRNILQTGSDVMAGEEVIAAGTLLQPAHLGLLAAAGVHELPVFRLPRVVIVATGSELVLPGSPIGPGQIAASNMVTLEAELRRIGIKARTVIIHDDLANLREQLQPLIKEHDLVLTCGGVLDGDKDLTMRAMEDLGVEIVFRRVRIGPGKGTCLGRKGETIIFNLPGGPPSNHVGFLLLALPAARRLAGAGQPFTGRMDGKITGRVRGQHGWTQLVYGKLTGEEGMVFSCPPEVKPMGQGSRLQAMAGADCLIELEEDTAELAAGVTGTVWKIR